MARFIYPLALIVFGFAGARWIYFKAEYIEIMSLPEKLLVTVIILGVLFSVPVMWMREKKSED